MNKNQKPTAVFFGTPEIAATNLKHLLAEEIVDIKTVVTNPDKPAGRGRHLQASPVKTLALEHGIEVLQPQRGDDPTLNDTLRYLSPDLFIVVAYGHILPLELLKIPKHGALNLHPSLLPRYRGANPIASAIDAGETETGVTIMLMDEEMDHGPIIAQRKKTLSGHETTETLTKSLAQHGATLFAKTIPRWINGTIDAKEQNHTKATYTKMLTKNDGHIDWSQEAEQIERHVRAFNPWPGAWSLLPNNDNPDTIKRIKLIKVEIHRPRSIKNEGVEPGTLQLYNDIPVIRTGDGVVAIIEVQLEGKQPVSGVDFLNGHQSLIGKQLQ